MVLNKILINGKSHDEDLQTFFQNYESFEKLPLVHFKKLSDQSFKMANCKSTKFTNLRIMQLQLS